MIGVVFCGYCSIFFINLWFPCREEGRGPDHLVKSQLTVGFLRNTGTDFLEKQLDPLGPTASRVRPVRPSVKYVDNYN